MFSPEQRALLRSELLACAGGDPRISGAAITGSGATADREDRWSDIDLAFGVANAAETPAVLADWTSWMYDKHEALHHLDMRFGAWIYRVFLLSNTLQVDLAFAPADEFRALAPTFRLVLGTAREAQHVSAAPPAGDFIGMSWLYALHARSCIARGQLWQAEHMISAVRDQALAMACARHGLPSAHGKGIDQLPVAVTERFEGALVRRLDAGELARAFRAAMEGLILEIRSTDEVLADRLEGAIRVLADGPAGEFVPG